MRYNEADHKWCWPCVGWLELCLCVWGNRGYVWCYEVKTLKSSSWASCDLSLRVVMEFGGKEVTLAKFTVCLGYLEKKIVMPHFYHWFLLLKSRNELADLNPTLTPGSDNFMHPGGVWHQSGLLLEQISASGGSSKAAFEGHFLIEVLWNSEELKWWKAALVCERR